MSIHPDDPRLTDYALGELDDATRAELERELSSSPDAQRSLDEIRRVAGLLGASFADEHSPALDDARRVAILAAEPSENGAPVAKASDMTPSAKADPRRFWSLKRWAELGVAVGVGGVVTALLLPSVQTARESARMATALAPTDFGSAGATASQPGEPLSAPEYAANGPRLTSLLSQPAKPDGFRQAVNRRQGATAGKSMQDLGETDGLMVEALSDEAAIVDAEAKAPASRGSVPARVSLDLNREEARVKVQSRGLSAAANQLGASPYDGRGGSPGAPAASFSIAPQTTSTVVEHLEQEVAPAAAVDVLAELADGEFNTEAYDQIVENPFKQVVQEPLSTFSIDVDTASYANIRRFLTQSSLPPAGAVRIEEMINYFSYDYAQPTSDDPFAVHVEVAQCPWEAKHRLVRIGIKGRELAVDKRPPSNLVFLIDVSGSMQDANKLTLVKTGLRLLTEQLSENDRVAIVVYAGSSGQVLASTPGNQKETILASLDQLEAGGSTNGAGGIEQAYQVAVESFIKGGSNRVILCTDGDFNVGVTDESQLVNLIEGKAKSGVFLSVLGFGMGNYKDATLEKLSDKGNGNYAYIDTEREARKVLVEQLSGTLVTIAKDVKLQLEFNPAKAAAYRLIGYENRLLAKEDFNDDQKDAGEIGAGHTVTALYEVIPAGEPVNTPEVDPLEYQTVPGATDAAKQSSDLLMLKLRYKQPDGDTSKLMKTPVADSEQKIGQASPDFQFASSVAAFGMLLRHSQYATGMNYGAVLELAQPGLSHDAEGYRAEFIELVKSAQQLSGAK